MGKKKEREGFVKIATVQNRMEAEQVIALLKKQHIPAYYNGGFMDVYTGGNPARGEDIMVPEAYKETAKKLIKEFVIIGGAASGQRKVSFWQRVVVWIILLGTLGALIFSFASSVL
ncbi:DUF2007 domain-containing protein [Roseburia hominis]